MLEKILTKNENNIHKRTRDQKRTISTASYAVVWEREAERTTRERWLTLTQSVFVGKSLWAYATLNVKYVLDYEIVKKAVMNYKIGHHYVEVSHSHSLGQG